MPENVNVINKELIPSVESLARENKKGEGGGGNGETVIIISACFIDRASGITSIGRKWWRIKKRFTGGVKVSSLNRPDKCEPVYNRLRLSIPLPRVWITRWKEREEGKESDARYSSVVFETLAFKNPKLFKKRSPFKIRDDGRGKFIGQWNFTDGIFPFPFYGHVLRTLYFYTWLE